MISCAGDPISWGKPGKKRKKLHYPNAIMLYGGVPAGHYR